MLAGFRYLACGDFAFNPEHPPLLTQFAALPLLAVGNMVTPPLPCNVGFTAKLASFELGNQSLVANGFYPILVPARLAAAAFSIALAILMFFGLRRMLGGGGPAALAVGLLAITPATFAAVVALYAGPAMPPLRRTLVLGGAFGLMLLAKHSALVIVPILGVLMLAHA